MRDDPKYSTEVKKKIEKIKLDYDIVNKKSNIKSKKEKFR